MKAVAQNKPSMDSYKVEKVCADTVIVTEGSQSQKMSVEDALKINGAYQISKQRERNSILFNEMRKEPEQ